MRNASNIAGWMVFGQMLERTLIEQKLNRVANSFIGDISPETKFPEGTCPEQFDGFTIQPCHLLDKKD